MGWLKDGISFATNLCMILLFSFFIVYTLGIPDFGQSFHLQHRHHIT